MPQSDIGDSEQQLDDQSAKSSDPIPAKKPIYVARWREDGQVREMRLVTEELFVLGPALAGNVQQLEEIICKRASENGWLLNGEKLHYVSAVHTEDESTRSGPAIIPATTCVILNFAFCPSTNPKQRKQNLKHRQPDWVEVDHNRLLTYVGIATFVLVIVQLGLPLQQNAQFDDALGQFKTVVGNYVWQASAPGLWPTYLPETNEIELVNYGQTSIGISSVRLLTYAPTDRPGTPTVYWPMLKDVPTRLREGESIHISTSPGSVNSMDILNGVMLEVKYVYLGNRYRLVWPAAVRFIADSVLIEPQGEPAVEPIHEVSPTATPVKS